MSSKDRQHRKALKDRADKRIERDVRKHYLETWSLVEASRLAGCGTARAGRLCADLVEAKKSADVWQREEILKLLKDGLPASEVAEKLGIATQTVYHIRRRYGVVKPPLKPGAKPRLTDEDRERLFKLRDNGATITDAADQVGVSVSMASAWLAKRRSVNGEPTRTRSRFDDLQARRVDLLVHDAADITNNFFGNPHPGRWDRDPIILEEREEQERAKAARLDPVTKLPRLKWLEEECAS